MLVGGVGTGQRGIKGRNKWDNCNDIINKRYLQKKKEKETGPGLPNCKRKFLLIHIVFLTVLKEYFLPSLELKHCCLYFMCVFYFTFLHLFSFLKIRAFKTLLSLHHPSECLVQIQWLNLRISITPDFSTNSLHPHSVHFYSFLLYPM